jgi:hypothetical protein
MRRLILVFVLAFVAPAYAEPLPPAPMAERPEARQEPVGRSGFWTNPYPAKGGAYRWRMMAVGGVLLAATGYLMWRLVKKASAERATRMQK